MRKRFLILGMLIPLLGPALACESPTVCTNRGCFGGLTVFVPPGVSPPFTLRLTAPEGEREEVCTETSCADAVFFPGFTPDSVQVELSTADMTLVQAFAPDYEEQFLNGPTCGVTCIKADIRL